MISLLQPLWGFSGDNKGARRHSPSLLLPHLLPQVLFCPLGFWGTHFSTLENFWSNFIVRDRSSESVVGGKWRTHDPIFSHIINCLGLKNLFSPSANSDIELPQQVWLIKPPLSLQFDSQYLPPVHVIFLAAYYVLCRRVNRKWESIKVHDKNQS